MKIYGVRETFGVAGLGIGMGIIGSKLTSAGLSGGEGLTAGGEAATGFISPMVNISMGGQVIRMLKDFRK